MSAPIIKTHKELAKFIEGKRILHSNSMGKDSVVCLEWLTKVAKPSAVVSVHFRFMANHPGDEPYFEYLKNRYPQVEFLTLPNGEELADIVDGMYQSPLDVNHVFNAFTYYGFKRSLQFQEAKKRFNCEYMCFGHSRYESVVRATQLYRKGLVQGDWILPIGLMTKKDIMRIIRASGLKLHPCYKTSKTTYDALSYWKMRSAFLANPQYYENVRRVFPLIELDRYRYERLFR